MYKIVRTFLWVAPVWGLTFPVYAGISLGAGTEYMSWREYDDFENRKLLEETGFRGFADAVLAIPLTRRADVRAYGRVYSGDVDYDGELQPGNTPYRTVTKYSGGVAEVGLGYRAGLREGRDEPLAFIAHAGIERWSRDLTGPYGYVEEYQITYLRLGAEQNAPNGGWTARGGVFWPLSVQEEVKLFDGISLEPEGKPSFFLSGGYRFTSGFETGLNLHTYRFGASDPVLVDTDGDGVNDGYVFQPRSELDTLGLYLKYVY